MPAVCAPRASAPERVAPAAFRAVMAGLAASVSIVTVDHGGATLGVTISSLVSLSLEPPLVLFTLHERSSTLPHLAGARFGITVLAQSQRHIATALAARDRSALPPDWLHPPEHGEEAAGIAGGVVRLTATCHRVWQAGDHALIVARVLHASGTAGCPLLHFRSNYAALAG